MWVMCCMILIVHHDPDPVQILIKQKSSLYCHSHGLLRVQVYSWSSQLLPQIRVELHCKALTVLIRSYQPSKRKFTGKDKKSCNWNCIQQLGWWPHLPIDLCCHIPEDEAKYVMYHKHLAQLRVFFLLTISQHIHILK